LLPKKQAMEVPTVTKRLLRRYTSKQITEFIKQWKASKQSKKAFCESSNINYYTFVGWTAPKKKKKAIPASSDSFIPIKVRGSIAVPFAEVHYANGSRIVFHESVGARYLRDITK
jgi:hypothetical protein